MSKIDGIEAFENVDADHRLSRYTHVTGLSLTTGPNGGDLVLSLARDRMPEGASAEVEIVFVGVSDLTLNNLDGFSPSIQGLEFTDISDRGWEQIKWDVGDYEDGRIQLQCRSIKVRRV